MSWYIVFAFIFHICFNAYSWFGFLSAIGAIDKTKEELEPEVAKKILLYALSIIASIVFSILCISPFVIAIPPIVFGAVLGGTLADYMKNRNRQSSQVQVKETPKIQQETRHVEGVQQGTSICQQRAQRIFARIPQHVREQPVWQETLLHLKHLITLIPKLEQEIHACERNAEALKQTIQDLGIGKGALDAHEQHILARNKQLHQHIKHLRACEHECELVIGEAHADSVLEIESERVRELESVCRKLIEGIGQGSRLRTLVRKELGGDSSVVEIDLQVEWSAFCDESEPKACSGRALGTCSHDAVREAFERRRLAQAAKQKVQSF